MAYSPLAVGLLTGVCRKGQSVPAGTIWATRRAGTYDDVMNGPSGDIKRPNLESDGKTVWIEE